MTPPHPKMETGITKTKGQMVDHHDSNLWMFLQGRLLRGHSDLELSCPTVKI